MTSWTKTPELRGLAALFVALAIMALSHDTLRAQTTLKNTQTTKPGKTLVFPGITKTPSRVTPSITGRTPTVKWPTYQPRPKTPTVKWPTYQPRPKTPTVKWPTYQPRPKTPKYVTPKPKKPKVTTAKRPPRRPTGLAVIQPIPQFIANQVVVLFDGLESDGVDDALAQSLGLTKLSSVANSLLDGRIVTFSIPGNRQLPQVIAALTSDPRVSLAQPNNIYLTVGQKNHAAKPSAQYSLTKLSVEPVHKTTQGRNVPVAVIDTGIDVSHPVLSKSVALSFDAVGNGPPKVQQHGTAIAGLIAGKGKVKGVAPLSNLLAVRAFYMHPVYKRPVTSSAILLRALDWSFVNKARIFNLSFAGPYDPLVKAALTSASNKGVILVAAAGNGGSKAAPAYPAAYENVIAITALDHKDKLYAHANRGNYLTVAAPGVDVLVPTLKRGYRYSSGTSLAAAHISGLVALLLERHPEASAKQILDAIRNSAHDLGPKGHDVQFGAGRADAHASLLSMSNNAVKLTSDQ